MNTANSLFLTDGVRKPVNQDKRLRRPELLPAEKGKSLFDKRGEGAFFNSLGLPPPMKKYTPEISLSNFQQMGNGKKLLAKEQMLPSRYGGRKRKVGGRKRVLGARKRLMGGFFKKIFSGIKSAVEKVAPVVKAIQPVSRFGSMLGLPAPAVEVAKMVGVGRRRRRVGGMVRPAVVRRPTMVGMARRRRRVGGARRPAGSRRLMRLF